MPTTNPAVTKYTPKAALHPAITATGTKGFLIWMKSDPVMGKVYQQIQPQLNQLLRVSPTGLGGRTQKLGSLGCCSCFGWSCCYGAGQSSYCGTASSDSTIAAAPTDSVNSSGIANSISNIINTGASLALTAEQIANANAITTSQLQQSAAGYRPLNLGVGYAPASSLSSFFSGTMFGLPTWLVLGGGITAVILLTKK